LGFRTASSNGDHLLGNSSKSCQFVESIVLPSYPSLPSNQTVYRDRPKLRGTIIYAFREHRILGTRSIAPSPIAIMVQTRSKCSSSSPAEKLSSPSTDVTYFHIPKVISNQRVSFLFYFLFCISIDSHTNFQRDDRSGYEKVVTFIDGEGDFPEARLEGSSNLV
jgi:hypothetical protein